MKLILHAIVIAQCCYSISGLTAMLTMHLIQSGFHRTIKYTTVFTQPKHILCDYSLRQTIPNSVYISTDQLDALQRLEKIDYHTASTVDVEKMASDSPSFDVFVYGHSTTSELQLPIHFRYHLPGNRSFVRVHIDQPKLYVNCLESSCAQHEQIQFKCKSETKLCQWCPVHYDKLSENIVVSIPIGYSDFRGIVTTVTILVSWISCYYVVATILIKSKMIKQKI